MSDSNVFGGDQSTGMKPEPGSDGDILKELVGDGKKFKSVEDLAKGKVEADKFIEQLKREQAELRAELSGKEELLKQVGKGKASDDGNKSEGGNQTPIDKTALEEIVVRVLESKTVGDQRKANLTQSVSKLREVHGDDQAVSKAIQARAAELGYSPKELQEVAEKSPAAFLTIMGVDGKAKQVQVAATKSGHSSSAAPKNSTVMNKAYCDEVKKTDPKTYWSPKFQNEMMKARAQLGPERFYS